MNAKNIYALVSLSVLLGGIFLVSAPVYGASASKKITVTSTAFKNGGKMAAKYAAVYPDIPGSEDLSPPLAWKLSKKTAKKIKSFAISIIDLHPIAEKAVHLFAYNLPANLRSVEEGAFSGNMRPPVGTVYTSNVFGDAGYGGPAPPADSGVHVYEITVYGLNVEQLSTDTSGQLMITTEAAVKTWLKGKVVAKGKLKGKFEVKAEMSDSASSGPTTKMVGITSAGYSPSTLTIKAGDTVVFQNNDADIHWPASAVHPTHTAYPESGGCIGSKFDACAGLAQSETFSFTFNQKGTWLYHDHLNPSLTGSITVE